jgi:hypothetical protein
MVILSEKAEKFSPYLMGVLSVDGVALLVHAVETAVVLLPGEFQVLITELGVLIRGEKVLLGDTREQLLTRQSFLCLHENADRDESRELNVVGSHLFRS